MDVCVENLKIFDFHKGGLDLSSVILIIMEIHDLYGFLEQYERFRVCTKCYYVNLQYFSASNLQKFRI